MNLMNIFKRWINNNASALTHKNFRYFWCGQAVSLIGTWMQRTAQLWLVYSMTNSPFLIGLLGVFQFAPMLLFSLFAGVLVDRYPKKKILLVTQTVLMIQAFIITILVWTGTIKYWHILILALIMGIANTFDMPARQSYIISLVGKKHLMNAIALNSVVFNLARIVGPAVSGIMMKYTGMTFCFLINALSFIAVIWGIHKIDIEGNPTNIVKQKNILKDIKSGLSYSEKNASVLLTMLFMAIICTFAMNNDVIIPVVAKTVLHKSETGYSVLLSCMGAGSLIGAFTIAKSSKVGPKIKNLITSSLCISVFLLLAGITTNYYIDMFVIGEIGFFNLRFLNTANSLMQLNTSDEYRGRVMSLYSLLNAGTTPIGNLFAGTVTEHFGALTGYFSCGAVTGILIIILLIFGRSMIKQTRNAVLKI